MVEGPVGHGVGVGHGVAGLLRDLAPRTLGAVVGRYGYGNFADAEDAVQEALLAASTSWPTAGLPDDPLAWLIRVSSRRMADLHRNDEARRRREDLAASWSREPPGPASGYDDTLTLFFMCCHPSLSPASAVALTLRAVGGLTTKEIAAAFLAPEATMAQRISRAKRMVAESEKPLTLPDAAHRGERLALVLRVVYLIFNEGYTASGGPELGRGPIATEAIRIGRLLHELLPDEPEVTGLLALMLLTEARRAARTTDTGTLVPLEAQDRSRWDDTLIAEGTTLATGALKQGPMGEYAAQAAIAALHDAAPRYEDTPWDRILSLYSALERMTDSPVVRLNRAIAVAMVEGPEHGLELLDELTTSGALDRSHRPDAVRAHLLEHKGDIDGARAAYVRAAALSANLRERDYLTMKAAALGDASGSVRPPSMDR